MEGDGKIYEILHSLKFEYGEELKWFLPYPGDWHMLKNFQIFAHMLRFSQLVDALRTIMRHNISDSGSITLGAGMMILHNSTITPCQRPIRYTDLVTSKSDAHLCNRTRNSTGIK